MSIFKETFIFSLVPGYSVLTMDSGGQDILSPSGLVWYYDEVYEWVNVCDEAMGYIEAQVLCNSINFPYFTSMKSTLRLAHSHTILYYVMLS